MDGLILVSTFLDHILGQFSFFLSLYDPSVIIQKCQTELLFQQVTFLSETQKKTGARHDTRL